MGRIMKDLKRVVGKGLCLVTEVGRFLGMQLLVGLRGKRRVRRANSLEKCWRVMISGG